MFRHSRSATVAVLVTAVLGVAGCGAQDDDSSSKFTGDKQQVAKVIEELENASTRRVADSKKICTKLITDALARTIAAQGSGAKCDKRVKDSIGDIRTAGGIASLEVLAVTIDGDKAVASVKAKNGDEHETSDYKLVKSGNVWRISAVS